MKFEDMSNNQLLDRVRFNDDYIQCGDLILSRFADLQAKVQELEKVNIKSKEAYITFLNETFRLQGLIRIDNQQIADLQQKLENYKCCGNCKLFPNNCIVTFNKPKPQQTCQHWQPDNLTREERNGKVE
jgi:hypothetical protein